MGQAYEEFMVSILKSVEVSQMKIGRTRKKDLDANEVSIYIRPNLRFLLFFFFFEVVLSMNFVQKRLLDVLLILECAQNVRNFLIHYLNYR